MNKQNVIEKTVQYLHILPEEKLVEVSEFAEFLYQKQEEVILQKGIQELVSSSESFKFLEEEEDLYTLDDVIKKA
ncbi:MAG: hypothetical protein FJ218_07525 [Ignavibacteria bacterium]|nr:hypothetical protein [Ignavibacteria bacterium]